MIIVNHGQPHIAGMVQHQVGYTTCNVHVTADVKLLTIDQERVVYVPVTT